MDAAYFQALLGWHEWAWSRVLEQVALLTPEQYSAPSPIFGTGSIRSTLVHAWDVEETWLCRSRGFEPGPAPSPDDLQGFTELRQKWSDTNGGWRTLLAGLPSSELSNDVQYGDKREYTNPLWGLIIHSVTHGVQHRSEVAAAISQLGYSPGNLDFIIYLTRSRGGK